MRRLLFLLALGTGVLCAHGPLHEQILLLTAELEAHPDDPDRLVRRGELYLLHGLPADALPDFERAARLRPNDITNEFRLGRTAFDLGATNEAIRRLEQFVAARPDSPAGRRALAQALRSAGRPREAAQQVAAAIALIAEPPPEAYLEQARDLIVAQAPADEVLQCLDGGMARHGPLPALQLLAVDVEMQRGETDRAVARLDALAARAERKERWLSRRGDLLLRAGRTNEARASFSAARAALDALPEKQRRAWTAGELRHQLDAKLAGLGTPADAWPANAR